MRDGEKPGWEGYLSALGKGIKCILSPVCGLTAQTITGTTAPTPTTGTGAVSGKGVLFLRGTSRGT